MSLDALHAPLAFFESVLGCYAPLDPGIIDYAAWWASEGYALADGSDDNRVLARGYAAGIIRRVNVQESLLPSFTLLYITAFYDPRIAGIYADSLIVRHIVDKYAPDDVRDTLLERLQASENPAQSAHWLPVPALCTARATADGWRLTNDGKAVHGFSDLTLLTARPEGAADDALFLVPKQRDDGSPNIGQGGVLRDSHAYLMGKPDEGAALLMEAETLKCAFSTIIWLGAAQGDFARRKPATETVDGLRTALALAWAAAQVGDDTAREVAGLYSDTYQRFRLLAHLASLQSLDIAKAVTPVTGGPSETGVERALAKLPTQVFETGPPLLAELDEYADGERLAVPTGDLNVLAQVTAQAFARKFGAVPSILS